MVPVLGLAGILEVKSTWVAANDPKVSQAFGIAAQTSCDAIANVRTVKSMNAEQFFVDQYMANVDVPYKAAFKGSLIGAAGFGTFLIFVWFFETSSFLGFSQAMQFWIYAIAFYAGYKFIEDGRLHPEDFFTTLFSIVFGAIAFSQAAVFLSDSKYMDSTALRLILVTKARLGAIRFFKLVDRVPPIDAYSMQGEKPIDPEENALFSEVKFSYPQRSDVPILRGVSLNVPPKQNVALVGPSGSGKSTVIALVRVN